MLNLVLFGPPGAGKGTQSEYLIQKFDLVHLSTGNLLRAEIALGTTLGLEAQRLMDIGLLAPDEVVIGMIDNKLKENTAVAGFIFDGFPRTVAQAEALDALLAKNNTAITCMVALEVDEEELTRRVLERGKTSGRPDDQDEAKVSTRIQIYNSETRPVADYYAAQGKFSAISGIGAVGEIFKNICAEIEKTR